MPITLTDAAGLDSEVAEYRSEVLARIETAEREIRFLENDLADARERLAALRNYDLAYSVCDHPESSGWRCDHCGEFADHGPEFWDWKDTFAVRLDDTDRLPCPREYYRWLILRSAALGGYPEHGTLPLTAHLNS